MAAPLSWQHSAEATDTTVSDQLPSEVVTCLENARFLHLATCTQNIPHVSLMNHTYLPSHPFSSSAAFPSGPTIIMTSNPSSKKTMNLVANPNVSLLVHDWVSSRPPASSDRERSPTGGPRSSLAAMLMQMNSTAMSSISATINGSAHVLESGSDEEKWCKEQHLRNNTFETDASGNAGAVNVLGTSPNQARHNSGDGGRNSYIEDEDVRVVVVSIHGGRISDWKGGVKDWVLDRATATGAQAPLVNGV